MTTVLLRIGTKTYRADESGVRLDPRASLVRAIRERAKKRSARPRKVPPPAFPRSAEMAYAKALLTLTREAKAVLRARLDPELDRIFAGAAAFTKADAARTDDYAKTISTAFADIEIEYERRVHFDRKGAAAQAADRTEKANQKEHRRFFKSLVGVDVVQAEPWLRDFSELFIEGNVGLIKSISSRYFGEVRDIVESAAVTGQRPESLAADIEERFGVSKSWARLLARDQVGKYNGQLTAARQQRLGVKSFVWRTSGDERVRESHREKEGRTYQWQNPPHDTGMPGEDHQCRCTAEPNLEDLADE